MPFPIHEYCPGRLQFPEKTTQQDQLAQPFRSFLGSSKAAPYIPNNPYFHLLLGPIYNDARQPWQVGFQYGASPTQEGSMELHDSIFLYLVVISFGVLWYHP